MHNKLTLFMLTMLVTLNMYAQDSYNQERANEVLKVQRKFIEILYSDKEPTQEEFINVFSELHHEDKATLKEIKNSNRRSL